MIYWDTSAIIVYLAAGKFLEIKGVTRPHALAEFYARSTGKGFKVGERTVRLKPELAADRIQKLAAQLTFVNLDEQETADALKQAAEREIRGGHTHDFLHVAAAVKAGATEIWTCNESDFEGLSDLPLKNPS